MRIEGGSDLRHQVASDLAALAGIAIPNYPRLPGWVSWVNPEPGVILLRGGESLLPFKDALFGKVAQSILPTLTGTYSTEALTKRQIDGVQPTTVLFFLKVLAAHGYLEPGTVPTSENEPSSPCELAALLAPLGQRPDTASLIPQLQQAKIVLITKGPAAATLFKDIRKWLNTTLELELELAPDDSGRATSNKIGTGAFDEKLREADLVVVYASPFDSAVSAEIAPYLLKKAARALYVWQEGATAYLGPTVIAGYTPCTRCLTIRRTAIEAEGFPASFGDAPAGQSRWAWKNTSGHTCWAERAQMTARLVAPLLFFKVVKLLSGIAPPATIGAWLEIDAINPRLDRHTVLRVPRCICAEPHSDDEIRADA